MLLRVTANTPSKNMITQEEIKSFLEGGDPEEFIVAVEFDYLTDSVYKVIEPPGKQKVIKKDTFIAFAWVGDLKGINFYNSSKYAQKDAMSKYGIVIEKFFLLTNGAKDWQNIWIAFALYALVVAILFAFLFKHKHNSIEFQNFNH